MPDLSSLPPPPSEDTTHAQRMTTIAPERSTSTSSLSSDTPSRVRFKAFPYTGENDYVMLCQQNFLSVGGGDGRYGLWIDDSLAKGVSSACPTFANEGLSQVGEKFGILGVEVWSIGSEA